MKTVPVQFGRCWVGVCVALLAACAGADEGTQVNKPAASASASASASANPVVKPAIYDQNCIACHSDEGQGAGTIFPDLWHVDSEYFDWIVRNGKGAMSRFSVDALTDAELQGIKAYFSRKPMASDGAGIYKDLCSSCHGAAGAGKGSAPALKGKPLEATVRSGLGGKNYASTEYMPAFAADKLSDAQLKLVTDYLK
jgi:mono/diheme cytochrome c family protein